MSAAHSVLEDSCRCKGRWMVDGEHEVRGVDFIDWGVGLLLVS